MHRNKRLRLSLLPVWILLVSILFLLAGSVIAGTGNELELDHLPVAEKMLPGPDKEKLPQAYRKMDSILQGLLQGKKIAPLQIKDLSDGAEPPPRETASVYIFLKDNTALNIIDDYAWKVDNRDESSGVVAARIYLDRLEELASRKEVQAVRAVLPPLTRAGSVTSAGDALHWANLARSTFGVNGSGIKIGVISGGVDNWESSRDSGDLPAGLNILSNNIGGDEGTAMLEIIHDLAPAADLYFHDHGGNILAFNDAVDALVAAGCRIIVDDVCWVEEPFFEDGIVAQHIASVIEQQDILYLSAAGNAAQSHYQGMFYRDSGEEDDWHDFSRGATSFKDLYVRLEPGQQLTAVLQWDDPWGGSANDYDIYLFTGHSPIPIAASENTQSGADPPLEVIRYTNSSGAAFDARICVKKYNG
ncbi:MAG TPA: hypothetical protein PLY40_08345, partial [Bacillota bacterium]|nr:hypothetical protein [Bacillota bacterium]